MSEQDSFRVTLGVGFVLRITRRGGLSVALANNKRHIHIAKLTYNAASEMLTGQIRDEVFHEIAHSGGSRGHKATTSAKAKRYLHSSSLNDSLGRLATTPEIYDKNSDTYKQRGGTLPPGHYECVYLENYKDFHECIRLDQMHDAHAIVSPFARHAIVHHRGGFYIHGHGPKGSDGCLVLAIESRRKILNQAVRDFDGRVILEVTHASYMLPAELEPEEGQVIT
jgi:hypothetical protein